MKDNPIIADQVVFTLGEIERMADGMNDDDPMRHAVRKMKQAAEQAITAGLRVAQDISDATRIMRRDAKGLT